MTAPPPKIASDAERALASETGRELHCEGFESSRIFALSAALLAQPQPGGMTPRRLVRSLNAIFLFIVAPTHPLDPTNPRTRPRRGTGGSADSSGGGALRPALWYIDMRRRGTIGRGQPPKTLLGRKRRADVVIECLDGDLVDIATGKKHAQKLYNSGRIKVKGDLDKALRLATVLSHERSKLYGAAPADGARAEFGVPAAGNMPGEAANEYSDGAPAPYSDISPARSRL